MIRELKRRFRHHTAKLRQAWYFLRTGKKAYWIIPPYKRVQDVCPLGKPQ